MQLQYASSINIWSIIYVRIIYVMRACLSWSLSVLNLYFLSLTTLALQRLKYFLSNSQIPQNCYYILTVSEGLQYTEAIIHYHYQQ